MKKLLFVLLAVAALATAADVTGTWTGPMTMKNGDETRDDTAYLVLKQEGGKITGTIGPNEERRYDITTGTAEGDNVYIVDEKGERYINVDGQVGFRFFGELILDCLNRTEKAMTQAHTFKAAELCLKAQAAAKKIA